MPVQRLQQTVDQFSAEDMQRKHAGQGQNLVRVGQAVSGIAETLAAIKKQKEEAKAQAILDGARTRKAELDLLLADKTVAEQEQIMASSKYKDAYEGYMTEAAALPGKLGEQLQANVASVQTKVKLGHLTNMANQMGRERKERVKETLSRYRSRIMTDPSATDSAAEDAGAAVQMFMQTPGQHKAFSDALERETVLGHLEAYTNAGPHQDHEEANKLLNDKRTGELLSAAEIRRFRGYTKPKEGADSASLTARNSIVSGAIDLSDFRYLRNAQGDPKLTAQHKRQLNMLNGHIRALAGKGEAPDVDNMAKLFIRNPADKADRDWNKRLDQVGKALGELYATNPRDYVAAVLGPEQEAAMGHGDAVSVALGSRVSSKDAAELSQNALEALRGGTFADWNAEIDTRYGDAAYMVKKEAINRFYHGKSGLKNKQQAAALRVSIDPQMRQMFPQDKLRRALETEAPFTPQSGYIPVTFQALANSVNRDQYEDAKTVLQMLGAVNGEGREATGKSEKTQASAIVSNYRDGMNEEARAIQDSVVDMTQSRGAMAPNVKAGLLEDDMPYRLTPEFAGSLDRIDLEDNAVAVKRMLNTENMKRYAPYLDEDTNTLLDQVPDAQVFLEPDSTSGGERFRIGIKVPTGRVLADGWLGFGGAMEERIHYMRTKNGQDLKVNTRDIYQKGTLMPKGMKPLPGPKSMAEKALQWLQGKAVQASAKVLAPDAPPQLTPEQLEQIAPVHNLNSQQKKNYETQFKPAIDKAIGNSKHLKYGKVPPMPKETLGKAMAVIAMIESNMGAGKTKDGKFVSTKGALGPFQLWGKTNTAGIDPHNMEQSAGRAVEIFTDAYRMAKKYKNPAATTLDYLVVAARIYNGGPSFATQDTLNRVVGNRQSQDTSKDQENNKYANKFLHFWGSKRRLR